MQGEVEDSRPGRAGLAPDEDFPVVAGAGEDVAVFGVCPGYAPYCSFMAVKVLVWRLEGKGEMLEGKTCPFSVSVSRC